MTRAAHPPPAPLGARTIDLFGGHPSTSLLPTQLFARAATAALDPNAPLLHGDHLSEDRHPLHYGPDLGNEGLRAEIGRWTAERYASPAGASATQFSTAAATPASHICLTPGASYGLLEALQQFTSPQTGYTRRAFVVSPTYFLAAAILQDAGFADRLVAVPALHHGRSINLALLREKILEAEAGPQPPVTHEDAMRPIARVPKRLYRYVLYCVPTYSNPTGESWDVPTRRALLELAREFDILLISDDVYDFLGNPGDHSALLPETDQLLPRLVALDRATLPTDDETGHTLSNCSFSKLLGPGIRCGWLESATSTLITQLGVAGANHSGGAPCQFASAFVHRLLLSAEAAGMPASPVFPSSPSSPASSSPPSPGARQIDAVIATLQYTYVRRCAAARRAVRDFLPADTRFFGGNGGFFVWLVLPPEIDAADVVLAAAAAGEEGEGEGTDGGGAVELGSGTMTECPGGDNRLGWGRSCVRVSISYSDETQIREGIRRFGAAVERWRMLNGK